MGFIGFGLICFKVFLVSPCIIFPFIKVLRPSLQHCFVGYIYSLPSLSLNSCLLIHGSPTFSPIHFIHCGASLVVDFFQTIDCMPFTFSLMGPPSWYMVISCLRQNHDIFDYYVVMELPLFDDSLNYWFVLNEISSYNR